MPGAPGVRRLDLARSRAARAKPEAAQRHQDDADMRRGNVVIVFHGEAPEAQRDFIDSCL